MVELKINRNVMYALLTLVGLVAALGIGIWFGRAGSESTATAPAGATVPAAAVPPAGAPQMNAPEISLGGTAQAVPEAINTPGFGEMSPEEDAAVQRMALADAVAKVGDPNVVFVDTRTDQEFQSGRIKGAVSMPAYTQDAMLETLPKDKEIILYCAWNAEHTSARAAHILGTKGYTNVKVIKGGWNAWKGGNHPTE